ncbi:MAG: mechanosensitive ion channel family protein [Flavobacteriaceae bacterium]|nr:mechanosensitive ion channel family protein [Flavobacteriaceae bacterium]
MKRSKDPVASQFVTDIVLVIFYIILTLLTFRALGLSAVTQTIIGAAGLTTFIIGFALKDIGENFLAGIVMIFDRPFEMGDLIQIDNQLGRVIRISIRETTIKTTDGKDVYIPNSDIIKKHFINYTIDDQLRETFEISVFNSNNIRDVIAVVQDTVSGFNQILKSRKPAVLIKNFENGTVQLSISYWYSLRGTRARDGQLKTDIMLAVLEKLKENNIAFPDHVQDIKLAENTS